MSKKAWEIKQNNGTAEIRIYGYIGSDKVNAEDFVSELRELEKTNPIINLRINSGGGSVFEGLAIFNAIKNSSSKIVGYIDGLAASMASVIILACTEIYMSKSAMLMTHKPSGAAMGNADSLQATANMLMQLEDIMVDFYVARTGLTKEDVKATYLKSSDNWINATQALEQKLIDGVYDAPAVPVPPTTMRTEADLVNFFTAQLKIDNNMKQVLLTTDQLAIMGLTADAADVAVNTALAAVFANAQKTKGLESKVVELQGKVEAFESSKKTEAVANLVAQAITAKKITEAQKEQYTKLATADFETTKALIDGLSGFTSLEALMAGNGGDAVKAELEGLAKMSGRDLYMQGKLPRVKELSAELYKAKYKEYFGSEPTN